MVTEEPNALPAITAFRWGIVISVNFVPPKANSSIEVTEFGTVTLARFAQFSKSPLPIEVIESGIVTLVRLEQFWKAYSPI